MPIPYLRDARYHDIDGEKFYATELFKHTLTFLVPLTCLLLSLIDALSLWFAKTNKPLSYTLLGLYSYVHQSPYEQAFLTY